jgi:carboxyl-terminal processing protease
VEYKVYEGHPDVGYISISTFRKDTAKDFKLAVRDLEAEGCDKFIIDLRENGGGLTNESLKIADYLLPACRIMTETTKNGKETVHNSKASSADLNCVVLVNGNTASASEILSAAIQDNDAGTIIGSKTFGKGVTQVTKKFRDGSAIKITSTEYFRPSGDKVNGVGITQDIETDDSGAMDKALEVLEK